MNTSLQIFSFQQTTQLPIRTVLQNSEPWFVASDVCSALDIVDHTTAVNRLDSDEKDTHTVRTLGGNQQMLCVNESGLYHLIFTSRKEEAKAFRRWVTSEVLPSIRKTGSYSHRSRLSQRQLLSPADEQTLIMRYVERLQNPTARDLGRYLTRYPVATLRQKLRDLSEQGLLREWFTGKAYRYKIK